MATHSKFILKTTVDITNHLKSLKEDKVAYGQKQNYLTVINTIGLRVNPTIEKHPIIYTDKIFNNKKVWQLEFSIEFESALSIEMMEKDFMYVPFIVGLEETAEFDIPMFVTKGHKKNIIFELVS